MTHSSEPQSSPNWRRTLFERKFHIPGTSFIHMLFTWRFWRRVVIGLAVLATLIGLVWTEENIRGKLAWERYEKELRAAGEPTRLEEIIPPPVPDDQNFAMAPFWIEFLPSFEGTIDSGLSVEDWTAANDHNKIDLTREGYGELPRFSSFASNQPINLHDWQQYFRQNADQEATNSVFPANQSSGTPSNDITLALSIYDEILADLYQALDRPKSNFPIRYDKNYQALLPHLSRIKTYSQLLGLIGASELEANDPASALATVNRSIKLRDSISTEPLLISFLVRAAVNHITANTIWEGMLAHQWSIDQLDQIEKLLSRDNWFEHYTRGIHGEMVMGLEFCRLLISGEERLAHIMPHTEPWMETVTNLVPDGFIYQNMVWMARYHHELSLKKADVDAKALLDLSQNEEIFLGELEQVSPYTFMARQLVPAVSTAVERAARAQAVSHLAITACQLEKHYLDSGEYPESLDGLIPKSAANILHDPYNGQPLRYLRAAPDAYKLYSVGKNMTDDGGALRTKPNGQGSFEQLDLTWPIGIPQEKD